jgi:hypothetical protein
MIYLPLYFFYAAKVNEKTNISNCQMKIFSFFSSVTLLSTSRFFCKTLSKHEIFKPADSRRLRFRGVAANDPAAWRSGGIPPPPFQSARPAAVAPNRKLCADLFVNSKQVK